MMSRLNIGRASLWAVLCIVPVAAYAQAPQSAATKPVSLQDAIGIAVVHHPLLQAADAQVRRSAAQIDAANAHGKATVTANAGYNRLDKDPSFEVAPFGTLVFGQSDNWTLNLAAQYPVYTGGKVEAYRRQAENGLSAADQDRVRTRQQVVMGVTQAYLDALKARDMIDVAQQQVTALEAQRKSAEAMFKAGVSAKIDLLRSEVALASAREMLLRTQNGYATALAALNNAMGQAADTPLELSADVPALREAPASLAAARTLAAQQRPELAGLQARKAAAAAGVQAAVADNKPKVAVFAQLDAKRPTFMPETGDWSAGIMVQKNVFDGGLTRAEIRTAETQVQEVAAMEQQLRNGIELQVTDAFLTYNNARQRTDTVAQAVAQAEESLRLARVGYENEVTPMTDVLAAQAELTRARTDLLVAKYDVEQAQARLLFAVGVLDAPSAAAK